MVCLHHSYTPSQHLLLAPVWGRILGSVHLGYIHLLCCSQDVRHPSFAKEVLTACRDVSDPLESLSCVFFFFFASRKQIQEQVFWWEGDSGEGNESRLFHHCPAGT